MKQLVKVFRTKKAYTGLAQRMGRWFITLIKRAEAEAPADLNDADRRGAMVQIFLNLFEHTHRHYSTAECASDCPCRENVMTDDSLDRSGYSSENPIKIDDEDEAGFDEEDSDDDEPDQDDDIFAGINVRSIESIEEAVIGQAAVEEVDPEKGRDRDAEVNQQGRDAEATLPPAPATSKPRRNKAGLDEWKEDPEKVRLNKLKTGDPERRTYLTHDDPVWMLVIVLISRLKKQAAKYVHGHNTCRSESLNHERVAKMPKDRVYHKWAKYRNDLVVLLHNDGPQALIKVGCF